MTEVSTEQRMMSLQEFEHLPLFSSMETGGNHTDGGNSGDGEIVQLDEEEQLPAMWEDGGGLGVGIGFNFLGRRKTEGQVKGAQGQGQWAVLTEDRLTIFAETAEGVTSQDHGREEKKGSDRNFAQRRELIEENLSQIYSSPFTQIGYADSHLPLQTKKFNHHHHHQQHQHQHHHHPHHHHNQKNKSALATNVSPRKKQLSFHTLNDDHRSSNRDSNGNPDDDDDNANANNEGIVNMDDTPSSEDSTSTDAATTTMTTDFLPLPTSPTSSSSKVNFADTTMKASLARAAQRAVSGYRSCDDADLYVGTRVKPTLILARAPPSPCGILRRNNKKAANKPVHGTVRWADGRPTSIPPADQGT